MQRILALVLLLAMMAGCFDDEGNDDDGTPDDGNDDGDNGGGMGGGTDDDDNVTRETVQVTVTWSGAYLVNGEYNPTTVRVPANSTVELTFENDEANPGIDHDLVVEGIEGARTSIIGPGEDEMVTFDVGAPTETKFFCSVQGHRGNGMEGDFVVE